MQLPLAHSGWLFKEEATEQEDTQPWLPGPKEEKMELDLPTVKGTLGWGGIPAGRGCGELPHTLPCAHPPPLNPSGASERRAVR